MAALLGFVDFGLAFVFVTSLHRSVGCSVPPLLFYAALYLSTCFSSLCVVILIYTREGWRKRKSREEKVGLLLARCSGSPMAWYSGGGVMGFCRGYWKLKSCFPEKQRERERENTLDLLFIFLIFPLRKSLCLFKYQVIKILFKIPNEN